MGVIFSFLKYLFPTLETLITPLLIVVLFLIMQKLYFKEWRKTFLYILFSLYLVVVYRVTGLPDLMTFEFNPRFQLTPFYDIKNDALNCMLNIFLFIPLGVFLPALWRDLFSFKNTMIWASAITLLIELMQIFCGRLTDINDLMTNLFGAFIGFCILRMITKAFPKLFKNKFKKRELVLVFGSTFWILFFVDPILQNFVKDIGNAVMRLR